jgi:putative transposase
MTVHQQMLYHVIFSTKHRQKLLAGNIREDVFSYLAGIASHAGGHALRVGGHDDHVHLLLRIPCKFSVSDFVGKLKSNSSKNINEHALIQGRFDWQDGYGAFTVCPSQVKRVMIYIDRQPVHHAKLSFEEEYIQILEKHGVDYDQEYLFG